MEQSEQYNKPALSYAQQLDLLAGRGLLMNDRLEAEKFLSQVNYFRFSAYCLSFEKSRHVFKQGVTFEDIRALYEFDRCLRFLIDEALEVIEIYFRSLVAHHLSHTYGFFAQEDPKIFKPNFDHAAWILKIHDEAVRSKEKFIMHYKSKYLGFPQPSYLDGSRGDVVWRNISIIPGHAAHRSDGTGQYIWFT